jgi:hypothetical protein
VGAHSTRLFSNRLSPRTALGRTILESPFGKLHSTFQFITPFLHVFPLYRGQIPIFICRSSTSICNFRHAYSPQIYGLWAPLRLPPICMKFSTKRMIADLVSPVLGWIQPCVLLFSSCSSGDMATKTATLTETPSLDSGLTNPERRRKSRIF